MNRPRYTGVISLPVVVVIAGLLTAGVALSQRVTESPLSSSREPQVAAASDEVAVFAGGCFWGIEAVFEHLNGVKFAESGYAGGDLPSPSYDEVSSGRTGHAEAVRVVYDPSRITYEQLLEVFFTVAHDPTQLNRQGPDVGSQYRSMILYGSEAQRLAATAHIARLAKENVFSQPIVTEVVPLRAFHMAEDYHQDYMAKNPHAPYIMIHDAPKVANLKRQFPQLYHELAKR